MMKDYGMKQFDMLDCNLMMINWIFLNNFARFLMCQKLMIIFGFYLKKDPS